MFVNVGFGNFINTNQIISICRADSSPLKRLIAEGRSQGIAVDATQGRKTKTVIVMKGGQLVLSALTPDTIAMRCNQRMSQTMDIEEEEYEETR